MKKVYRDISVNRAESLKEQLLRARESVVLDKLKIDNHYELVKEFDGKLFINDCNAIDLNACIATIEQQAGNIIWIKYAPPIDRDLKHLKKLVDSKVKALLCFGEGVENAFTSFVDHLEFFVKIDSVTEGIKLANNYAKKGDVILFSPGAPNYKFFESTSDWNKEFSDAIKALKKEKKKKA
jgi:UDP-N-acetylmuramoylalanine--D-glutamate ligase